MPSVPSVVTLALATPLGDDGFGLSAGQRARIALARAIALDPELVMYDEPFAGLDPISMGVAARLIRELNDALGVTSIVVSHDVDETFSIADHVVFIANGGIAAQGTAQRFQCAARPHVQRQHQSHSANSTSTYHHL